MFTAPELSRELARIRGNGLLELLRTVATTYGLPLGFWVAINSRETNCVNELGDFQGGEYHGVGMCQIDIQHDIARKARDDGSWKTLAGIRKLQEYGAEYTATNIAKARADFKGLGEYDVLRIAANAYNEGMGRAERDAKAANPDQHTTGHDYGKDVMARKAIFDVLLGVN